MELGKYCQDKLNRFYKFQDKKKIYQSIINFNAEELILSILMKKFLN